MLNLTELNETRERMLAEFDTEHAATDPYYPTRLNRAGRDRWPDIMSTAIRDHDDEWIRQTLLDDGLLVASEPSQTSHTGYKAVNGTAAAATIGLSEFNTWYVRGLTARLLDEGVHQIRVYRANNPKWAPAGCALHEGLVASTQLVFDGHRARYHPHERDVFAIPYQPNCHHSIERLT